MSSRRRHIGDRDAPEPTACIGVFGLSLYTTERELEKEFSKFGPLEKVTVVLDGKVVIFYFSSWLKYVQWMSEIWTSLDRFQTVCISDTFFCLKCKYKLNLVYFSDTEIKRDIN